MNMLLVCIYGIQFLSTLISCISAIHVYYHHHHHHHHLERERAALKSSIPWMEHVSFHVVSMIGV